MTKIENISLINTQMIPKFVMKLKAKQNDNN